MGAWELAPDTFQVWIRREPQNGKLGRSRNVNEQRPGSDLRFCAGSNRPRPREVEKASKKVNGAGVVHPDLHLHSPFRRPAPSSKRHEHVA